jgi:hypothetical protein
MKNYNIQEHLVNNLWVRSVPLEDVGGIIAVITLSTGVQVALMNAPVLPRMLNDHALTYAEVIQLFSAPDNIASDALVGVDEQVISLQLCVPTSVSDSNASEALDNLQRGLSAIRSSLHKAAMAGLGSRVSQPQITSQIRMPKIKVYPKDMEVIFGVLSNSSAHAQKMFLYLSESWNRRGGTITTTGTSICLDMTYGERTARLAMLMPGIHGKDQPVVALFWEALERLDGLPPIGIQAYFKTVEKLATLRKTESSAFIKVGEEFTQSKASKLLKAMKSLAETVVSEEVEPKLISKKRTAPNIDATLKACPPEWVRLFTNLLEEWRKSGGIVHCPRPGRIYLRLQTKAHQSGSSARRPHLFNLLVLAAPKGKKGCRIKIADGLSAGTGFYSGYLDCIPEEVNQFERKVSVLPGFTKEGVVARINLGPEFKLEDGKKLMEACLVLKEAEELAE